MKIKLIIFGILVNNLISCVGDNVKLNVEKINRVFVGSCSGDSLKEYSKGSNNFEIIKTWLIKNDNGWKNDIASRACDIYIKFENGTILVSKLGISFNYKNKNGKNMSAYKEDKDGELFKILIELNIQSELN